VLFILLAVVHTWPLASAPATLSRNDTGDTVLHEWTLAWVAHQVVRDPLHLFDANIFYPERTTLAYSDHLFVQAMMTAPILGSRKAFVSSSAGPLWQTTALFAMRGAER
jgi:hypothetical protein